MAHKNERVEIRCSQEDKAKWQACAEASSMSLSEWASRKCNDSDIHGVVAAIEEIACHSDCGHDGEGFDECFLWARETARASLAVISVKAKSP